MFSTMRATIVGITTVFVLIACGGSDSSSSNGSAACDTTTCGGTRKCDVALGCVECLVDGDCAGRGGPFCIRGSCEACRTNGDCGAAAPACWPGDGDCHPACTNDAGCPPNARFCDTASGICQGCRT